MTPPDGTDPAPATGGPSQGRDTSGAGPRPDVAGLGYEQAREALVEVVRKLEAGGATLEESLELWERGEALAAHCERWLAGARARVTQPAGPQEQRS